MYTGPITGPPWWPAAEYMEALNSRAMGEREYRQTISRDNPLIFGLIYYPDLIPRMVRDGSIHMNDATLDIARWGASWAKQDPMPGENRHAFCAPRGAAKALALDTPLPTPTGWTTMGDVRVGDLLLDESGSPCAVTAKSPVWLGDTYRVQFSDGSHIDAHADHEWVVVDGRSREKYNTGRVGRRGPRTGKASDWRDCWDLHTTVTTEFMAQNLRYSVRGDLRWRVPNTRALDLKAVELPIDPYVLGFWLGDGATANGTITINEGDYPTIKHLLGAHTVQPGGTRNGSVRVNITNLIGKLRALDLLGNKHIPDTYLRSSVDQRRELVRGLMDSDGTNTRSGADVVGFIHRRLIDDTLALFRTLGLSPRIQEGLAKLNGRVISDFYRIAARFDFRPFHVPRYRWEPPGAQSARHTARTVTVVDLIESAPTQCVTVSGSRNLYLAGPGLVPTHNSTWGLNILPMWASCFRHRRFIAMVGITKEAIAGTHMKNFTDMIRNNDLLRYDYPNWCTPKPGTTATATEYQSSNGTKVVAAGIRQGILGLNRGGDRPDVKLIDDPDDAAGLGSALKKEQRLATIRQGLLGMNPRADVGWFGTVTSRGAMMDDLVRDAIGEVTVDWVRETKFKTHYYPAIMSNPDGTQRSLWPSEWPLEWMLSQRGLMDFELNFMNRPPSNSSGTFWQQHHFVYGIPAGWQFSRYIMWVDPAVTNNTDSDYTGIAVAGYAENVRAAGVLMSGNIKVTPEGLKRQVAGALARFYPLGLREIHVEKNQGGLFLRSALAGLELEFPGIRISLPHSVAGKPAEFAEAFTHYERGRVRHSQQHRVAEEQMMVFPTNGIHDDCAEAVVRSVNVLLAHLPTLAAA